LKILPQRGTIRPSPEWRERYAIFIPPPHQAIGERDRRQAHRFHDIGKAAQFHQQRAALRDNLRRRLVGQPHMPHQRQTVGEEQLSDRRLAADPAQQIGLFAFDQRGVEQGFFIDRIARPRAREQLGYDRISLGKGQQYRVADNGLAATDELRDTAVAAGEAAIPHGVDACQFGAQGRHMLVTRRVEKFEFEQVAQSVDPVPEGSGRIAAVGVAQREQRQFDHRAT